MSEFEFGGILPVIWQIDHWWQPAEVQIIVNWLDIEIEKNVELRLPVTAELIGWRNREVRDYIKWCFEDHWYEELAMKLYGNMPLYGEYL